MRLFEEAMRLFETGAHLQPEGLAAIVRLAYAMNANGKQRTRPINDVLQNPQRPYAERLPFGEVKIWSDLHGDMES